MSEQNAMTLNAYNANVAGYIDGSPREMPIPVIKWLNDGLRGMPYDAGILEIGSGFGRDARYIEEVLGYRVERTDAAQGFVDYLQNAGQDARQFNIVTDALGGSYDCIIANAVLLHLTRSEMLSACKKVYDCLQPNVGRFCLSVLQGAGDRVTKPEEDKTGASRYFCYWMPEEVVTLLFSTGFKEVAIMKHTERGDEATWLHMIAGK